MHVSVRCLFTLSLAVTLSRASDILSVTTNLGIIQGSLCAHTNASGFQSIPYAQPPVGDLRFEPPQPYNASFSNGLLNATQPAPSCIQFGNQFIENGAQSEDCLYLDVWVPPNTTPSSALPVKVWVYGGSETAGGISDPLYNGCDLAAADTLFVSIAYRLGPLGWLALADAGIDGNFGIQDILLGLQWVQSNIADFGGDPQKVLLFGQSAGADNTFVISTLPQASTLMKAAITESGGGRDTALNAKVQSMGLTYAKSVGCGSSDIACFKSKTVQQLNNTYSGNISDPYVDGKVIPTQPSTAGANVPIILGSNAMEGTLDLLGEYGSPEAVNATAYTTYLTAEFGPLSNLVSQQYPLSAFNASPFPAYSALTTISTDYNYKCPAYRGLVRAFEKGIPAWTYFFARAPSCPWYALIPSDPQALESLGATHTAEIPYVFGNIYDLPLPDGSCNFTDAEKEISTFMVAAWSGMAANATPNGGASNITWPAFDPKTSLGIKINASVVPGVVDYSPCAFFDVIDGLIYNASVKANGGSTNANLSSSGGNSTATGTGLANGTAAGGKGVPSPTSVASFTGNARGSFANVVGAIVVGMTVVGLGML
ncbi:hypothetical protein P7C71_g1679, partial [Lecanoromycetidae sp. Uapishka_2]